MTLLLEHGHLDLVIQAADERGEWFCAEGAVQELCRLGEFGRALEVMEPFVATGWRAALWAQAEILLRAGRVDEALDLVRPEEEDRASPIVCRNVADLRSKAPAAPYSVCTNPSTASELTPASAQAREGVLNLL
ncbi:hypothetical protein ACFY9A_37840 [Streptomyces rubradiris]|uniref:hypothetical protein n=1 Tax=Streptomyces rubradiris TaxID=285531 RepID=UPI0036E1445B